MSVSLFISPHGRTRLPLDGFSWKFWAFFFKYSRRSAFHWNLIRITDTLREDLCTFVTIPHWILLRMRNVSDKSCRECQNTHYLLTIKIPSLARQRCLPSWGPRRTPWFFCNFSTVWCGRLLKWCFLGFWNYNSVIQALLASNILCLFISTEVSQ